MEFDAEHFLDKIEKVDTFDRAKIERAINTLKLRPNEHYKVVGDKLIKLGFEVIPKEDYFKTLVQFHSDLFHSTYLPKYSRAISRKGLYIALDAIKAFLSFCKACPFCLIIDDAIERNDFVSKHKIHFLI